MQNPPLESSRGALYYVINRWETERANPNSTSNSQPEAQPRILSVPTCPRAANLGHHHHPAFWSFPKPGTCSHVPTLHRLQCTWELLPAPGAEGALGWRACLLVRGPAGQGLVPHPPLLRALLQLWGPKGLLPGPAGKAPLVADGKGGQREKEGNKFNASLLNFSPGHWWWMPRAAQKDPSNQGKRCAPEAERRKGKGERPSPATTCSQLRPLSQDTCGS